MMDKEEFEELIESIGIPYAEGVQHMEDNDSNPRVVFFEIVWDPITASGIEYDTKVSYQVSFFASKPRDEKLLNLKNKLKEKNINPVIYHEYLAPKRTFHSYFTVEVVENLDE